MKRAVFIVLMMSALSLFAACKTSYDTESLSSLPAESPSVVTESSESQVNSSESQPTSQEQKSENISEESESVKIEITVGDSTLTAVPEDNSSAEAFISLLQKGPVTVQMSDYAGMEKVGPLGNTLPRNDKQIEVGAGDVILYQGNQITIYYDSNSWSFTKLAVIEDATKESLLNVLGYGDVEVTFSLAE